MGMFSGHPDHLHCLRMELEHAMRCGMPTWEADRIFREEADKIRRSHSAWDPQARMKPIEKANPLPPKACIGEQQPDRRRLRLILLTQ